MASAQNSFPVLVYLDEAGARLLGTPVGYCSMEEGGCFGLGELRTRKRSSELEGLSPSCPTPHLYGKRNIRPWCKAPHHHMGSGPCCHLFCKSC